MGSEKNDVVGVLSASRRKPLSEFENRMPGTDG